MPRPRGGVRAGAESEGPPKTAPRGRSIASLLRADIERWRVAPTKNSERQAGARAIVAVAGGLPARDLTPEHVKLAAANIIVAYPNPTTKHGYIGGLRRILKDLTDFHGAPRLAQHVPQVANPAPRNITATLAEREALISAAPPWLRVWILLCSDLALRSGTATRIAPCHYNSERREISFRTKYATTQTLPVTQELADLFALATGPTSVPYVRQLRPRQWRATQGSLQEIFKAHRERLGITRRITPHDLRRTTAVQTLETTKDIRVVQALLGHKHLTTTLWYLDHHTTPVNRATLEAAKLNERKK